MWSVEQVVAYAGASARFAAGETAAVPAHWMQTGSNERAVWGRYRGSSAEPYDVAVEHEVVAARCTCPSRVQPCKHVIGLLLLWVRGDVAVLPEPEAIGAWADRVRAPSAAPTPAPVPAGTEAAGEPAGTATEPTDGESPVPGPPAPPPTGDAPDADDRTGRDERIERLVAGLVELDRWIEDRMRSGLADPSIARFATWDELAARLTDARAGALANRIRRLAGRVGASPNWHADVLAELGILHLLASGGQRVPRLPADLADAVAIACGWQVRTADVTGRAPESDTWLVAGRSDQREDLIEVRRVWLYGRRTQRWAMALSFAAYRQSLDVSLRPGTLVTADVFRYPGASLRVIVGERFGDATPLDGSPVGADDTVAALCDRLGRALAAEPWLERLPGIVRATPSRRPGPTEQWVLGDHTGSLPIAPRTSANASSLAVLLAASTGQPVDLAVEWTPDGVVPLTIFLDDRSIDVGPRADTSFVNVA